MKCLRMVVIATLFQVCGAWANSQQSEGNDIRRANAPVPANAHSFFVRSTYLSFTNWIGENIDMYELHFGYRITSRDIIGVKAATWKLFEPMGIQMWDPNLMKKKEWFTGRIREYGVGPVYQRMLWKGLYASIEVMPMLKIFRDENQKKVDEGFRLYTSYHLGYHLSIFGNRLFVEPQVHCNYWPINSKGPEGFKEKEAKHDNFFLFEPNLYIGVNF